MSEPILFGAAHSVYLRAVRLVLEEKAVPYQLLEMDVFAKGKLSLDSLTHHPFGRIPAFEHDGFRIYQSHAITSYVDEVFSGPRLTPEHPRERARVNQIIGIVNAYFYVPMVWHIFVERVRVPLSGGTPDEEKISFALPKARICLKALEELMDEQPFLAGRKVTLADLHAAPMFAYFRMAPEGAALLAERQALSAWWQAMAERPSLLRTRSPVETAD
jgi:glutathione S-transferase